MRWLDLWKTFCAPTEKLSLSHPQAGPGGSALRPLSLLARIRCMFPGLTEEGGITALPGASLPLAPLPALDMLPLRLRSGPL